MNKLVCGILTVILCLSAVGALAQESDLPEVRWTYPVSLTEIQSKYAMLVNADNMLEKDFEPDPLVKVTGVKRATSCCLPGRNGGQGAHGDVQCRRCCDRIRIRKRERQGKDRHL